MRRQSLFGKQLGWLFLTGSIIGAIMLVASQASLADVRMPAVFSDHMVLQRNQPVRIWGWADPGEQVQVALLSQDKDAKADDNGRWQVEMDSLPAGGPYTMTVVGKNRVQINDILIGEVWICSGQSNMAFSVDRAYDADLEIRMADLPKIRLISVPQVGTQQPQDDFKGQWQPCSPSTVGSFSAVGYYFGRDLYENLDVPIGLIDNAWGGSSCEAWIRRDLLEGNPDYQPLLERWKKTEATYDHEQTLAKYRQRLDAWKKAAEQARKAGEKPPARPRAPQNPLVHQHRPANLYNGVLKPIIGYGIRGVIWYQGESNASRAYQYRDMFKLMIQSWRDEWNIGEFPFFWVQLADFRPEKEEPSESDWAELREAQTMTLQLPNTGQAVIIDCGEDKDIHPKDKQTVGRRLARWALATVYEIDVPYRSPEYQSMEKKDGRIVVKFDYVGNGLQTFDTRDVQGFTIAGEDREFVRAEARLVGPDQVEVWSDQVADPVAVRYAWADNPICNLQDSAALPVTPFRTDQWPGVTADNR